MENLELKFFKDICIVYSFILVLYGTLYLIAILFFGLSILFVKVYGICLFIVLSLFFIFFCFSVIYSLYKIIYIKTHIKKFKIYTVTFGYAVDWFIWMPGYYYNVLIPLENGVVKTAKTTSMFSRRSPSTLYYPRKSFDGRRMNVAYDAKRNKVIVINYHL